MANQEQLEILKQGVGVWNRWREDNPDVKIDLREADLWRADLKIAHLMGADLRRAYLREADLTRADLTRADLTGAILMGADLRRAHLIRAILMRAILTRADLTRAHLWEADLRKANLRKADLRGADLGGADLRGADLGGADLTGADLTGAFLREADLTRADLGGANLMGAGLTRAKLKGTDLTHSTIALTIFGNNDLSASIGLETIRHNDASIVGTDTIQLSKGKIPIDFLRGCGLSDLDIEYAKLAAPGLDPEQAIEITYEIHRLYCDRPIQFFSCFISHNNKDHDFAKRLHDDLQDNGVRCWLATEDMRIGDPIRPTIDREIRLRDKLLVILSEASIQSEWVGDEVEAAIEEESASNRLVLFPVRLDDAVMNAREDWAAKIRRRRHIGDFSNWKDEGSYRKAFERLLRGLKAGGE